jgi:hypothetical protein
MSQNVEKLRCFKCKLQTNNLIIKEKKMKILINQPRAVFTAIFCVIVLFLLSVQAYAADNPGQIIREAQARLTEIPTYTAPVTSQFTGTVYQSLPSTDPNAGKKALVKEVKGVSDKYQLRYERGKKLKTEPIAKTATSAQRAATVEEKQPPLRVSFDENAFYEQVLSQFNITSIEKVTLNEEQHNKIVAKDGSGHMQVAMWIDVSKKCLAKFSIQVNGEDVAEIICSYHLEKAKYWLPHSVIVKHLKQNETITLNYGSYTFAEGGN